MDWKKLLGSIPASVDEELRLRNVYLVAENRILRQQITGRVQLTNSDRSSGGITPTRPIGCASTADWTRSGCALMRLRMNDPPMH